MTSYPNKVLRNNATENMPLELRLVDDSDWRRFASKEDAERGFGMIDSVTDNAKMEVASGGEYDQYVYLDQPEPDVCCRIVRATARDEDGAMAIAEYPSDILDRDTTPMAFVDTYEPGQAHVLKVRRVTPTLGTLYWDVA